MELNHDATLWSHPADDRSGRHLLVLIHGYGSHEGDLFAMRSAFPDDLVVAALRAPLSAPPGFSWFPIDPGLPTDSGGAVDTAQQSIADWIRENATGFASVGILGFSQGAMLSLLLLRRDPAIADYAVMLSGTMFGDQAEPADDSFAAKRPPVFLGYGTDDPHFSLKAFEPTAGWLRERAELSEHAYPGLDHSVSPEELADIVAFLRNRMAP